jgi:hypothetical protein
MNMPDLQTPQGKQEEEPTIQTPKGSESEEELILPPTEPIAVPDGELEPVDTIIIKDGESYRQMKVYSVKSNAREMSFLKTAQWWNGMARDERSELLDYYKIFSDIDLHDIEDREFYTLDNMDKSQIALLHVRRSGESIDEHECKECGFKSADFDEYKDHMKAHDTPVGSQGESVATESMDCEFCEGKGKVIVEKKGIKECPRCEGEGTVDSNQPTRNSTRNSTRSSS